MRQHAPDPNSMAAKQSRLQGVDYSRLAALLIEPVKSQQAEHPAIEGSSSTTPGQCSEEIVGFHLTRGEEIERSIRWGLGLVYGQVARELGFTGSLTCLCIPEVGVEYACKLLLRCLANTSTSDAAFKMFLRGTGQ